MRLGQMKNQIKKKCIIGAIFIVLAVSILYGLFLWNPIVFDDLPFFMVDNAGNQQVSTNSFDILKIRSLPYATLAWTKAWFGLDLINFRIGNLILHAATCIALFGFSISILPVGIEVQSEYQTSTCEIAVFFAVLLFALHPVATYAAGYLVQRTVIMATLFSLLAMWLYTLGLRNQKPVYLWLTVPLYYLAVFSKEHAITLILIFPVLTILLQKDWKRQLHRYVAIYIGYGVIATFAILAQKGIIGSVYEINGAELLDNDINLAYPLSAITQSALYFKYIFLWLLPNPAWMSIDMREPIAHGIFSYYLIGAVAYIVWGVVGFWMLFQRGNKGFLGFAMLYPWLMFVTEFSTVRVQESFVLYRSYIWVVGAFCALPILLAKLQPKPAAGILIFIAVIYFPISMERLATLSHPLLVWDDAEKLVTGRKDMPGASRIYYNRGTEYLKIDLYDKAVKDLQWAVTLSPRFAEAHGQLAVTYLKKQDWQNAEQAFTKAINITNEKGTRSAARYYQGRAEALAQAGDVKASQLDYKESCRLGNRGCDKVQ